jgi:hypothetical protein
MTATGVGIPQKSDTVHLTEIGDHFAQCQSVESF